MYEIAEIPSQRSCIFNIEPFIIVQVATDGDEQSMGTGKRVRSFVSCLFLTFSIFSSTSSAIDVSLVSGGFNKTFQLSPQLLVDISPGLKPGTKAYCERIQIHGLPRVKNLGKFSHSLKVKVSHVSISLRRPNIEVCFHRNMSIGIGLCPQSKWQKVSKGSWVQSMSPFDHKLLDIRITGSSVETIEVSVEEEFFAYRLAFLVAGMVLLSLASVLSESLVFYYSSAMGIGVILVVLIVLFQGMKLLPTGRRNSFGIFIYSSMVGLGSFLVRYIPGLFQTILAEIGISEDMYNPLATFILAFLVLAGAWMGFWAVRKLVLTEDGTIDISVSRFVAWSIRIVAVITLLQSSVDPLLALGAVLMGIIVASVSRKIMRFKFLRRLCKKVFKAVTALSRNSQIDLSSFHDSYNESTHKTPEDFPFCRPQSKQFLSPGFSRTSPSKLMDIDSFPSTFHSTPERRKFCKDEWDKFTRESTTKAVEELASSPDFSKWVAANADRITVTPRKSSGSVDVRQRRWLFWF